MFYQVHGERKCWFHLRSFFGTEGIFLFLSFLVLSILSSFSSISTDVLPKFFLSHSLSIAYHLEWFQILSFPLCSFHLFTTTKVHWFHSFVKKQLSFAFSSSSSHSKIMGRDLMLMGRVVISIKFSSIYWPFLTY